MCGLDGEWRELSSFSFSAIEKELDRISSKEERGRGHRHLEAKKDLDEVMECYHRIRGHLGRLTVGDNRYLGGTARTNYCEA